MAPRNPKNPIKDLSDAVGGWLGGNRGTINPQVARVSRDLGTVAQTIDTFTGGFGAAAGRDVRNFAQGGSLPTNVAKTAAVNLAAGAVGAKAAQVAGRAVVNTPIAGMAINKFGNKTVLLHGSPVSGLRNIEPRIPPKGPNAPKGSRVYGMRTDISLERQKRLASIGVKKDELTQSTSIASKYARGTFDTSKPKTPTGGGSVYVIRTPKKTTDLSPDLLDRGITATSSTSPGRVVSEIKLKNKSDEQIIAEVQKKLRRAGVKVPKKK
jgi:hypothetical protein